MPKYLPMGSVGRTARGPCRRGGILIYVTVGMVAFAGFVSLAVDVGHVHLVKTQLQLAADAAARYGAVGMQTSLSAARQNVVSAAARNTADGIAVSVDPALDVEFGTWNSSNQTFTPLTGAAQSSATAIRVTCRRTAARGNPVSLSFGGVVGKSQCDVIAQSVAMLDSPPIPGIIGLSGITVWNNAFVGSYNSANNKSPNSSNANSKARIGTNGALTGHALDQVYGDALLGPGATVSGVTISGSYLYQTQPLAAPTMPPWSPGSNPGGIPQIYAVAIDTTLPGGSYWFTSLTIAANLSFSGPAVLHVNGNVLLEGSIQPSSAVPADLTIYQYGSNSFGDSIGNNISITADIIAPSSNLTAQNNLSYYGSAMFNSITVKNNANLFYDEAITATSTGKVVTVQ